MNVLLEILVVLALILVNGFLAMAEIAVVAARKTRLRLRAAEGQPGYQTALELAEDPSRLLSTVQIGITLIGILAGAFGGATLAEPLADALIGLGVDQGLSEALGVVVVVVVLTYISLVIGELAPKQIALLDPERVAALVARPMRLISRLSAPLVRLLTRSTSLVLRLLGLRRTQTPAVTEEEIKLLVDQGAELGIFEPIEDTIVDRVFHLGDESIDALATPRTQMIWLDPDEPLAATLEKVESVDYSHLPVARGNLDNPLGFVRASDLLVQSQRDGAIDLLKALQTPLYLPENMPVYNALEQLRGTGHEIAFVLDEYGGIQGLVTLRDLLEGLVGDLPRIAELHDPDVVRLGDGSYLLDGMIPIHHFRELFGFEELPGEAENHYHTLAGFVLHLFGRIPTTGESVHWKGHRVEVVDMDDMRIDKLHILPPDESR